MNAAANTPNPWPTTPIDQHEAIRRRAEEIYVRNGRVPGRDPKTGRRPSRNARESSQARRTAIIVVNGTEYVASTTGIV
jgi:hypothetical protein